MKNSADLKGCYPVNNSHLDLQNSSYPTRPYAITARKPPLFLCVNTRIQQHTAGRLRQIKLQEILQRA